MHAMLLVVASTALGVDVGWQPLAGGGFEYIIQIEPETLAAMKDGHDIVSELPAELRNVRRYRITVGSGPLPRTGVPPQALTEPPASTSQPTPAATLPTDAAPPAQDAAQAGILERAAERARRYGNQLRDRSGEAIDQSQTLLDEAKQGAKQKAAEQYQGAANEAQQKYNDIKSDAQDRYGNVRNEIDQRLNSATGEPNQGRGSALNGPTGGVASPATPTPSQAESPSSRWSRPAINPPATSNPRYPDWGGGSSNGSTDSTPPAERDRYRRAKDPEDMKDPLQLPLNRQTSTPPQPSPSATHKQPSPPALAAPKPFLPAESSHRLAAYHTDEKKPAEKSDANESAAAGAESKPWIMTLLVLFASLGANAYLGWLLKGLRGSYFALLDRFKLRRKMMMSP